MHITHRQPTDPVTQQRQQHHVHTHARAGRTGPWRCSTAPAEATSSSISSSGDSAPIPTTTTTMEQQPRALRPTRRRRPLPVAAVTTALVATAVALLGTSQEAAAFVPPTAPHRQAARAASALAPLRRGGAALLGQPQPPQQLLLTRLNAAADGGEGGGNGSGKEEAYDYEALRAEIREKLKGLFGAMAGVALPEEGSEDAAASLSGIKGGAGGAPATQTRPIPKAQAQQAQQAPASTTVSFKDLAEAPCEHAVLNPYGASAEGGCVDTKPGSAPMTKAANANAAAASASLASGPSPGAAAALGKAPEPVNENIARIGESVPNAWLAVSHSADLKKGELKKIVVDDKPVCLFRDSTGAVRAISDICLHRAAALSDGWLEGDLVVCPYHAYKFDGDGKLRYIPGVDENLLAKNKRTARTVWYKTMEQGGLVYIFPDAMRAGAIEQHVKPFLIPEENDPTFRVVQGTAEIAVDANLVVENLLDMLHISYVHTFGNMQEPLPFAESYDYEYDDEASQLLPYARTTFRYRAGPTSISKVVGGVKEVVVENEFHLPYTTVTRVRFGNDIKTIYVVCVPVSEGRTVVHYKLYRNFMYVHPRDESVVNKALDRFFQGVMTLTLNEDKEILESLYAEHQRGYVLSRYDKPLKIYRRTLKDFQEATKAREAVAERRTLEMELLRLIETTERGRKATRGQHAAILQIVGALEKGFQKQYLSPAASGASTITSSSSEASSTSASAAPAFDFDAAVNGSWHLVYANPGDVASSSSGSAAAAKTVETPLPPTATQREADEAPMNGGLAAERGRIEQKLKSAGAERYLLDFKAKGRPIWADTEQSMQTIDMGKSLLSNTAVYQGLLGIRTKVELNGVFRTHKDKSTQSPTTPSSSSSSSSTIPSTTTEGFLSALRKDVQFKTARVDFGGFKVTFPHMDIFGVSGWLETTFVDEHIRICRGNRGSIFVLTRRPLAPATSGAAASS